MQPGAGVVGNRAEPHSVAGLVLKLLFEAAFPQRVAGCAIHFRCSRSQADDLQRRWMWEDGHVSIFRNPSGYSNGNTYDWEGRQLSCEHGNRRVVRYEHSGAVTVVAEKYNGKRFNAPNDLVVDKQGGIYFTDPDFGAPIPKPQDKLGVYYIAPDGKVTRLIDNLAKPTASSSRRMRRRCTSSRPAPRR